MGERERKGGKGRKREKYRHTASRKDIVSDINVFSN